MAGLPEQDDRILDSGISGVFGHSRDFRCKLHRLARILLFSGV